MADVLIAALVIDKILEDEEQEERKRQQNKRKRIWTKEWLKTRPKFSSFNLLDELKLTSPGDYKNYLRMDAETYEELLAMVRPYIERQNTKLRDCISPNERLSATLRFLATGRSYSDLKFSTYIAKSTLSVIIIETCRVLKKVLKEFINIPKTEEEWKKVANDFDELWNFPHCIGAMDGKHINLIKPLNSGAYYFNYKKTYSIVLMAIVNAKYEFTMVEVGTNGRVSDGGVFSNTKFYDHFENGNLKIPKPEKIHTFPKEMPYVLVADDAFPLKENLLKPYSGIGLSREQENYNYRVSRARRIVENAFGIISSRFRVLLTTILLSPEKTTDVVLAICYLHNFLRKRSPASYLRSTDIENSTTNAHNDRSMLELQQVKNSNPSNRAKEVRNNFSEYFNTTGVIPRNSSD